VTLIPPREKHRSDESEGWVFNELAPGACFLRARWLLICGKAHGPPQIWNELDAVQIRFHSQIWSNFRNP
jgi:hypothetical protein